MENQPLARPENAFSRVEFYRTTSYCGAKIEKIEHQRIEEKNGADRRKERAREIALRNGVTIGLRRRNRERATVCRERARGSRNFGRVISTRPDRDYRSARNIASTRSASPTRSPIIPAIRLLPPQCMTA